MRTIFAIAALAASASAVKMGKIYKQAIGPETAEPIAAAQQAPSSNCNLVESNTWMTQGNHGFDGQFNTPYYWYNQMQAFWSQFNTTEAFQYFDCVHGNSDGLVDFTEYNSGLLGGGYVPDANCSAQLLGQWQDSYGLDDGEYVIMEDTYCGANTNNTQEEWCQLAGNCDIKSLNHNDFMINSIMMGADVDEAQTAWNAANSKAKKTKDIVTKKEWMKEQNRMQHGMYQFLEEQMIAVPLPGNDQTVLPVAMWYFSQQCYSAESFWTALNQVPDVLAWNSAITYDLNAFQGQLCQSWDLCEN